jgi:hypothetical protein
LIGILNSVDHAICVCIIVWGRHGWVRLVDFARSRDATFDKIYRMALMVVVDACYRQARKP